ncbi:MAG: CHAT domain-containing protein [Bacteroidia bacterium]|jgi:CHAT domain-containing protein|nr:CHAT domain-containing protein [Bacteroidia bacterium]GIV22553.1 MAG: hypothetical protein KatS3mg025_0212 [Bacteroidia bacterium]
MPPFLRPSLWLALGIGIVFAQLLPYEPVYFQGKGHAFPKKARSAYTKVVKRKGPQDPEVLAAGLAYALSLVEQQAPYQADSLLRQISPVVEGNTALPPQVRFYYYWIQGRTHRSLGRIPQAQKAFLSAKNHSPNAWQQALLGLEIAENLLLVGNAPQAADTLQAVFLPTELVEPYGTYLRQRKTFLTLWAHWQKGEWDSLPPSLPRTFRGEEAAYYQAQYTYWLALSADLAGDKKKSESYLKQSLRWAKKTSYGGLDLQIRAQLLSFLHTLLESNRSSYNRRIRQLNPILKNLRNPALPVSYATAEALQHLLQIGQLAQRLPLAENVLSLVIGKGEGLLAAQLQRIASQIARAQYRPAIALGYAQQAAQRFQNWPFATLEAARTWTEVGEAALLGYKYAQADSAFATAARLLAAIGEPEGPLTFAIREALARRNVQAGAYLSAQALLERQQRTYERLLKRPTQSLPYLRVLLLEADLALRLAQPAAAETLLRTLEKPIEDLPSAYLAERIAFYELKGDLAQAQGQFREAEKLYMEAVRLRMRQQKEGGTPAGEESASLLRLALLYQRTGRLTRAKEVYERITRLYQSSHREDGEVASYYISLTDFYLLLGDYLKAEETAKKARDLSARLLGRSSPTYVQALLASARTEGVLGRYDKQGHLLHEAEQAQRGFYAGQPALPLARTLYLLAENHFFQGKNDSASSFLEKAAEEAERAQHSAPLEYATLSLDIGGLWLALDSLPEAEERIAAAKAVLDAQVPLRHPDRMRAFLYQARLKRAQGEYLPALADFKRWLALWSSVYGTKHPEYPFYLAEMADSYWLARDLSSAKKAYEKAVSLLLFQVDRLFNGLTESEKTRYWNRVKQVLEHYMAFAFTQGTDAAKLKAYEVHLATKAFLLSETAQLRARLARTPDTTVQRIFQEWQDQKEYVVRLYAYSPNELKELGINLAEEENRLNELEKQLTAYIGDIRMKRPTWRQLRSALPAQTVAIDWIRLRVPTAKDSVVYQAVLTTPALKTPIYVTLPQGKKMENYYFFRYSQSILNFEKDTTSYAAYWQPIIEKLPEGTTTLYVSGDGVYYQINPSAMLLPAGGYIVDKYKVIHYSRLASLTAPPKPLRYYEGRKAYLIADPEYAPGVSTDSLYVPPLPGTAEEAKAIRDILQGQGILAYIYTRTQATENRLYETVSPYILHIATHGIFLPYDEGLGSLVGIQSGSALANPLFRSALLLAESGRTMLYGSTDVSRDGIANAYELLSLQLTNTELVALSACETGLGEVQNGEGVYGLQRAFLLAGARNLLLSLWKVDDEATRDFMIRFYTEWLQKKLPIEEAFWNTQKAMRTARSAPYFWGAFILVRP